MTQTNTPTNDTRHPTRRHVLAGAGALAAGALAPPVACAAPFDSGVRSSAEKGDWLEPFAAMERLRALVGREPCTPDVDGRLPCETLIPCDAFCEAELDVMFSVSIEGALVRRDGMGFIPYTPHVRVAPEVIDTLAREAWVTRWELWEPHWGSLRPTPCRVGDPAAHGLAAAIHAAARAAEAYVMQGRLADVRPPKTSHRYKWHHYEPDGRSPNVLAHPGLRTVRHAVPSPSRHHVPIDAVHELPAERGTMPGRAQLRTRLVLGPGADR